MPGQIPLIGEKFPEIEVVTTKGKLKLPDYFKGKWFVAFSHPGDFTPVCTTEFYSFAKRADDFRKLGVELIGLSVDSNVSHIEWVRWIKEKLGIEVPFPIIADPTGSVAAKLGMLHAESATATVRAVFITDPNGIVRAILYYPLELGRNIDEILRMVRGLQTIDRSGLVLPANWPNNELIGSKGIVRPPATVDDADAYLKKYKGYDWWFLYLDIPQ